MYANLYPNYNKNLENDADILLQIKDLRINGSKEGQSISFDLRKGEIHAIIGESDAGKSKIAFFLAGLQNSGSGVVFLNQEPVQIKNIFHSLDVGIGVLFKDPFFSYLPHLKIKEYLYLWEKNFVLSKKELSLKAQKLLEEYEINIDPDSLFISLNLEERLLIALMRLLAREPLLVVLDEPSINLSQIKRYHLMRIIRKYVKKGTGVLLLSNQLSEILQVSDRITILKDESALACFPIEYAKKYPDKILGLCFGREIQDTPDDEFKDVIDTLLHTTELLTSEYELQDLLNLLVEKITDATKADACNIFLFNEVSMNVMECFRHSRSDLPEIELKEKIVQDVITSDEPLIINNINTWEYPQFFSQKSSIKALACIPIGVRTKINGVIEVFYTQKKIFSNEEIELLRTFATQVAIAIENTRLLGRSTLLKEAHHRIKNNLQSIISLLLLQLQSKSEKSLEKIVWEIIDRIKTIAGVHEILSQDEKSIGLINFRNLVNIIISNYNEREKLNRVHIVVEVTDLYVSYKIASSLGLIINELLANCFEHAFTNGKEGNIIISLEHDDNQVHLQVSDNGIGLSNKVLQNCPKTLGLSLVTALVNRDLRGLIQFETGQGTKVDITFPKKQININ